MASCLVFAFGVALQTGASHLPTFIVGRFFAGAGVGLVSTLVPMYQSECAPRWIRGAVVASYQWAITIGILVASVVDNATKGRKDHSAWRIPIAIQFVWASVLFSGMSVLPETPRWLMKRDWRMQAAKSLSRLSGLQEHDAKVQAELDQISASLSEERAFGQTTYRDCFRRSRNKIALRSITSILVLSLQQLIGVVFIGSCMCSYGTTFFANAGVENPFLVSVAVNVVQMGMTLPGIWGVERLGRRPLLIGGAIVMSICAYLVAILAVATPVRDLAPQRAVIALVSIFFAAYASTWGPVAWVVPSEIVPLNVRAKVVSLSVAIHWLCTWAVSFASPYLANSGPGDAGLGAKIFFIWGSTSAISAIFAFTCVPETKGLALEQIDALYKHSTPITSARCGKELILQGSNASSTENKRVEREGVSSSSHSPSMALEGEIAGSTCPRPLKRPLAGLAMVVFASIGGTLQGYDTGTINGILQMRDWLETFGRPIDDAPGTIQFGIQTSMESLIVSILSAGTLLGALSAGPAGDILGRRTSIMIACLVFCLGVALQTGSSNLPTFIVGRFFAGFGVGLSSTLVPMYQSECSPKWVRGAVVSCYSLAITIGLLLSSVINNLNATKGRPDHSAWRIPIAIQFIWASILFFGMMWLPESPRWLVKENHHTAAAVALSRLASSTPDDPGVQAELAEIRVTLDNERIMGKNTYFDCFILDSNKTGLRTLSGICILALQQLTGINFLFYYGTTFFAHVGIRNPFLVSIANTIVNMGMTFLGIWATDRVGRRPLLLIGGAVMSLCAYLIAILGLTTAVEDLAPQRAVIALMCVYIAAFASTWGPVAWVVVGEIFPLNVRAKAMSLSIASHWLWNWAISFAAPYLTNSGSGNADMGVKVFFIWGSTCALGILFAYLCIPETKGLALEQLDLLYQHSTPVSGARYRRILGEGGATRGLEGTEIAELANGNEKLEVASKSKVGSGSSGEEGVVSLIFEASGTGSA
ncbi:general substrate transporter [Trametes polyzona]|nr:general substrate transporter [Trametes polyzona]